MGKRPVSILVANIQLPFCGMISAKEGKGGLAQTVMDIPSYS